MQVKLGDSLTDLDGETITQAVAQVLASQHHRPISRSWKSLERLTEHLPAFRHLPL